MKHILIFLCALLGLGSCQSGNSTEIDNRTVQTFDVQRFMGSGTRLPAMTIALRKA